MKYSNSDCLFIFSNCVIVRGVVRSTICDLQNNYFKIIPNSFADFVLDNNNNKLEDIFSKFSDQIETVEEYIEFLLSKNLGSIMPKTEIKNFPNLSWEFKSPSLISNMIIDFSDKYNLHDISEITRIIEDCLVEAVQVRIFSKYCQNMSLDNLTQLIDAINKTKIRHLDIIVPYQLFDLECIDNIASKYQSLSFVTIYGCDTSVNDEIELENTRIIRTPENLLSEECCGKVSFKLFNINIRSYTEGINNNSCLNRKLSIDADKKIKNCPSFKTHYGELGKIDVIKEVIPDDEFKKLWNITKYKIEDCKVCEFRAVCHDCRAYRLSEDIYSKPSKCNYNPHLGVIEN